MKNHKPLKKLKRKKQHKDYLRRKRKGLLFPKSKKFQAKKPVPEITPEIKKAEPKKKNWFERLWLWIKKLCHY